MLTCALPRGRRLMASVLVENPVLDAASGCIKSREPRAESREPSCVRCPGDALRHPPHSHRAADVMGRADHARRERHSRSLTSPFHRRRIANREFRNRYAGCIAPLHDSAYDITLRFCRLAQRGYRVELGDQTATFIRPAWDLLHRGLLARQSLMLDLQRMEFSYMERYEPEVEVEVEVEVEGTMRVSLGKVDPVALEGLSQTGRAVFSIGEEPFDEEMPDEYERRIKSVRVILRGVPGRSGIGGRLVPVGDRVHLDREKSEERSVFNLFGRRRIALSSAETDTAEMKSEGGRVLPFERCGVNSTWMLSFPGAVKAIEEGRRRSRHRTVLEKFEDVILEIRYTERR